MKKSKSNKNLNMEDITKDMQDLLSVLDDLNKTQLKDLNLEDLESKVNVFEEKYKDILPEESEDDLDSKK